MSSPESSQVVRVAITPDELMRVRVRAAVLAVTVPELLAQAVRNELASPLPTQEGAK